VRIGRRPAGRCRRGSWAAAAIRGRIRRRAPASRCRRWWGSWAAAAIRGRSRRRAPDAVELHLADDAELLLLLRRRRRDGQQDAAGSYQDTVCQQVGFKCLELMLSFVPIRFCGVETGE
jgi:hypothetical protein